MVYTEIIKEVKIMEELKVVQKAGAYDKDGKIIIPFEYERVEKMTTGVYEAKSFSGEYHLYTSKGKVEYPEHMAKINNVFLFSDKTCIFVLQDNEKVYIGEIDFEKNTFNVIYERVAFTCNNEIYYLSVILNDGSQDIFSPEEKKVILHLKPSEFILEIIEGKGFVVKEGANRKFYDLSGRLIVENFVRITIYDKVLCIVRRNPNTRRVVEFMYSYTGEVIVKREHLPGDMYALSAIEPIINGEQMVIITSINMVGDVYLAELLDIKGKVIFSSKIDYMKEMLLYDNDTILLKHNNLDMLCKLEKDDAGSIIVKKVIEADRIENVGYRKYRVHKDGKIVLYDTDGNRIQLKE